MVQYDDEIMKYSIENQLLWWWTKKNEHCWIVDVDCPANNMVSHTQLVAMPSLTMQPDLY